MNNCLQTLVRVVYYVWHNMIFSRYAKHTIIRVYSQLGRHINERFSESRAYGYNVCSV